MQRVLKRFYLILSLSIVVSTMVLFLNTTSFNADGSSKNILSFLISLIVYIVTSTTLLLMEHKMFYKLKTSYVSHLLVLVLFVLNFIIYTNTLFIILIIISLIILLFKVYYYQRIKTKFKVKDFKIIPVIYTIILTTTVLINFVSENYVASIFLLMPLLLLEAEMFLKIKLEKPNYEFNLIASLSLLISVFFLTYYSDLFTTNFDLIYNILFPAGALIIVFALYNLINKKTKFVIKTLSIE